MMGMVRMVAVVGVMRVMPGGRGQGIAVWQGEKGRGSSGPRRLRDCGLRAPDAEAGVGELGLTALRKECREGDAKWDENGFPFHRARPYAYRYTTVKRKIRLHRCASVSSLGRVAQGFGAALAKAAG